MGRQTTYSFDRSELICEQIAEGVPLREICRQKGFPKHRTVYDWLAADADFAARFARARLSGFDVIAQEALDIANTPHRMSKVVQSAMHGETVTIEDSVGHRKLQVETRLKLLAKWDPKRYGEKITTEVTGADGGPVKTETMLNVAGLSTETLAEIMGLHDASDLC